jgi:spore maturation protein CgeB
MMKILYVGPIYTGSVSKSFFDAFVRSGCDVNVVNTHPILSQSRSKLSAMQHGGALSAGQIDQLNKMIVDMAAAFQPVMTFYFNVPYVTPVTLEFTRRTGRNFCFFSDDMFNLANQTPTFASAIKHLDCVFTTKTYNVPEFLAAGVNKAIFFDNGYDPQCHQPVTLTTQDQHEYAGDVAFIGTFRPERADFLGTVIEQCPDLKFNIWGGGWEKMRRPIYWYKPSRWRHWPLVWRAFRGRTVLCDEMSKAIGANKICLGLLNARNRDEQTHRTVEIPACGGFMLAERTEQQRQLFEEDLEACYFGDLEELITKLRFYTAHTHERQQIARAGLVRCQRSGYQWDDRVRLILEELRTTP